MDLKTGLTVKISGYIQTTGPVIWIWPEIFTAKTGICIFDKSSNCNMEVIDYCNYW